MKLRADYAETTISAQVETSSAPPPMECHLTTKHHMKLLASAAPANYRSQNLEAL
jgi:hypothetical protein